jgi:hypothetical protein
MVPEDCGTVQTVLLRAVRSHVPARPAPRQSFSYNWGAAVWGGKYMFMLNWSALLAPKKVPWTACVHFCDSYLINISAQFNVLFLLLL